LAEVLMPEGNLLRGYREPILLNRQKNRVSSPAHFMRADAVNGFSHTFSFNADDAAWILLCAR
jgi:hypothetical protein